MTATNLIQIGLQTFKKLIAGETVDYNFCQLQLKEEVLEQFTPSANGHKPNPPEGPDSLEGIRRRKG